MIDTRPFAHAVHHYILNHRDLYGLPRKCNVAFKGGGAIDTVADTNDIGFMVVKAGQASSLCRAPTDRDGRDTRPTLEVDVGLRVDLAGITGTSNPPQTRAFSSS